MLNNYFGMYEDEKKIQEKYKDNLNGVMLYLMTSLQCSALENGSTYLEQNDQRSSCFFLNFKENSRKQRNLVNRHLRI